MFNSLKSPGHHRTHIALPPDREHGDRIEPPTRRHSRLVPRPISKAFSRLFDPEKADDIRRSPLELDRRTDPELEQLQNEIRELRGAEIKLKERYTELQDEIETMKKKQNEREEKREQLKQITNELTVAQKFLSTADSLSQAEVIRAMEVLNEEIFQLTSIVADKVQVKNQKYLSDKAQAGFRRDIPKSSVGSGFLGVVIPTKLEDPLAIQIGWQAILVGWCSQQIRAWSPEPPRGEEDVNREMDGLYKNIISANEQAIAGRWRSLTFSVTDEPSSETKDQLITQVSRSLVALPVLCGYISNQQAYNDLIEAFQQRLGPLLDKCLKFRRMVAEGITSTDIRPHSILSGSQYDPKFADLEYEDEEEGKGDGSAPMKKEGTVACCLTLGLYWTRPSQRKDVRVVRELILKSKVVLQDTLIEIIS